jgi:hypothetical protein
VNLLPGRLVPLRLVLCLAERLPPTLEKHCYMAVCQHRVIADGAAREDLQAYDVVSEEEVRAEALVRNLGHSRGFCNWPLEAGGISHFAESPRNWRAAYHCGHYHEILRIA